MTGQRSEWHISTHLVQDGRNDLIEDHVLICGRRKDFVELVCLVAHSAWSHRQLDLSAFDTIRLDHNTAVLAHFAVIAPSTPDDNVDVCLFSSLAFEIYLAL